MAFAAVVPRSIAADLVAGTCDSGVGETARHEQALLQLKSSSEAPSPNKTDITKEDEDFVNDGPDNTALNATPPRPLSVKLPNVTEGNVTKANTTDAVEKIAEAADKAAEAADKIAKAANKTAETNEEAGDKAAEAREATAAAVCKTKANPKNGDLLTEATAPAGTPCVFGVDSRDEGWHCIKDAYYGSNGWCYTADDKSAWGSCSEKCPLFGASKVLAAKIDGIADTLKRKAAAAANKTAAKAAEAASKTPAKAAETAPKTPADAEAAQKTPAKVAEAASNTSAKAPEAAPKAAAKAVETA